MVRVHCLAWFVPTIIMCLPKLPEVLQTLQSVNLKELLKVGFLWSPWFPMHVQKVFRKVCIFNSLSCSYLWDAKPASWLTDGSLGNVFGYRVAGYKLGGRFLLRWCFAVDCGQCKQWCITYVAPHWASPLPFGTAWWLPTCLSTYWSWNIHLVHVCMIVLAN